MKLHIDKSSLVVLLCFGLVIAALIVLLPMTAPKVLVLLGIMLLLVLVASLRSFDGKRVAVLGCFVVVLLLPVVFRGDAGPESSDPRWW